MRNTLLMMSMAMTMLAACSSISQHTPSIVFTKDQIKFAEQMPLSDAEREAMLSKQIYQMNPNELGRFIRFVHRAVPDLSKRIEIFGRKNLGQPYQLHLLGEFPYELHDNLPMFSLDASDCVVFVEHTYAMALSQSWEEFFWMLQRIRYKDGVIGVATRNHYTELDWNVNNAWLLHDITKELAGPRVQNYSMTVDRSSFLQRRHNTVRAFPIERSQQSFVPKEDLLGLVEQLQAGDFVNVISKRNGAYWASHVGLVVLDDNGRRRFLHSSEPKVREEFFEDFMRRTLERERAQEATGSPGQQLAGFKILRLNAHISVPPAAPQPRPRQD